MEKTRVGLGVAVEDVHGDVRPEFEKDVGEASRPMGMSKAITANQSVIGRMSIWMPALVLRK